MNLFQESLLVAYAQIEPIADEGVDNLEKYAQEFEDRVAVSKGSGFSIDSAGVRMLLPAVQAFATAVIRSEDSRRFTLTAIAIKRYQLAEGKFPERLDPLKEIGLNPADWTTVGGNVFGYTQDDAAYVWSYSFRTPAIIAVERPEIDEDGMEQIVTIR